MLIFREGEECIILRFIQYTDLRFMSWLTEFSSGINESFNGIEIDIMRLIFGARSRRFGSFILRMKRD